VLAVASLGVLMLGSADGYRWSAAAEVPRDGRTHEVALPAESTGMVWVYAADSPTDCRVRDAESSAAVTLDATDGSHVRQGGSTGTYVGSLTFDSGSGRIAVLCPEEAAGASPVYVEQAPRLPPMLATFGPLVLVPVTLGVAGVLVRGLGLALRRSVTG
jgi:hypothetical protein